MVSAAARKLRCAIYTRKSTEEGLEQAFNSLHAQREACEAYIISQARGLDAVADRYDGRLLRRQHGAAGPAAACSPISTRGKIDVVVVYKVDRLTRSLADFAKIVEVFDATASRSSRSPRRSTPPPRMGRLTLNVLLSFAQFEREVTGERIRDKIAASKTKGMWMGGTLPLGYDVSDRKLSSTRPRPRRCGTSSALSRTGLGPRARSASFERRGHRQQAADAADGTI